MHDAFMEAGIRPALGATGRLNDVTLDQEEAGATG